MGDVENFLDYRGGEKVDFLDFNTQGSAPQAAELAAQPAGFAASLAAFVEFGGECIS